MSNGIDPMPAVEDIVDKFSGMITKTQAAAILDDALENEVHKDFTDVGALLEFIGAEKVRCAGKAESPIYYVGVQDHLYRVFNTVSSLGGREAPKRHIVLGKEGSTIVMTLRLQSRSIDTGAFERNDIVAIDNGILDIEKGELFDGNGTRVRRITEGGLGTITDYSILKDEVRNVDVIGKIIGVGQIRYIGTLNSDGRTAVLDCTLTDFNKVIGATLWGSSAIAAEQIKVNDFVKIESCSMVMKDGGIMINANDASRIIANESFGKRLKART